MRKKMYLIFMLVLFFFMGVNVSAEIHGNGDAKDYNYSASNPNTCGDKVYFNLTSGIRVSILNSSGERIVDPIDLYSDDSWNIPNGSYGDHCSKIEHIMGTCSNWSTSTIARGSFGNFMTYEGSKSAISYIFNYLENSDYYNLKKIVEETGYNCIGKVGNYGCSVKEIENTYIVVEPMAMFGMKFATAYEMPKAGSDCFLIQQWAMFASFTALDGTYFGRRLSDVVSVANRNFYDAVRESSTNGVMIYSMSDVINIQKTGVLKVTKTNALGNTITGKSATFQIYNNSSCTGSAQKTLTISGTGTAEATLSPGTYYIKETIAPTGYAVTNEYGNCRAFKIFGNQTTSVTIKNKTPCEQDFDLYGGTREGRVKLYQKYSKYNNLLNFNKKTATEACSASKCSYDSSFSCLSGYSGKNSSFGENDLSCYNDTFKIGNTIGYCLTTFELKNKLGKTTFSSKAGQMFIKTDDAAAQGILNKKCYIYGASSGQITNKSYNSYVGDIQFYNGTSESLRAIYNSGLGLSQIKHSGNFYEFQTTVDYKMNPIYVKKGSGERTVKCNNCEFLGYGLISKLNDNGKYKIIFDIKLKSPLETGSIKNNCSYNANSEIIYQPSTTKEKLNLEFRIIDVNNPFPGKNGKGRLVGENWCGTGKSKYDINEDGQLDTKDIIRLISIIDKGNASLEYDINGDGKVDENDIKFLQKLISEGADALSKDCSNDNSYIKAIFETTNNSYDKNKTGPIYTINLDSSLIKKIRDYNKSHSYDDYNFTCDKDGNNCKNNFLEKFNIKRG